MATGNIFSQESDVSHDQLLRAKLLSLLETALHVMADTKYISMDLGSENSCGIGRYTAPGNHTTVPALYVRYRGVESLNASPLPVDTPTDRYFYLQQALVHSMFSAMFFRDSAIRNSVVGASGMQRLSDISSILAKTIEYDWNGTKEFPGLAPDVIMVRSHEVSTLYQRFQTYDATANDLSNPEHLYLTHTWDKIVQYLVYMAVTHEPDTAYNPFYTLILNHMADLNPHKHGDPLKEYTTTLDAVYLTAFKYGIPHGTYNSRQLVEWYYSILPLLYPHPSDQNDDMLKERLSTLMGTNPGFNSSTEAPKVDEDHPPSSSPMMDQLTDAAEEMAGGGSAGGDADETRGGSSLEYDAVKDDLQASIDRTKELLKLLHTADGTTHDIDGFQVDPEEYALLKAMGQDINDMDIYEETVPGNFKANVHFLLDVSSSLSNPLLDKFKVALIHLIEVIDGFGCPFTLTTFPGGPIKRLNEPFTTTRRNNLTSLSPHGGTPLQDNYDKMRDDVHHQDVIVVITDGQPNTSCDPMVQDMLRKNCKGLNICIGATPRHPVLSRNISLDTPAEIGSCFFQFMRDVAGI